MKITKYQSFIGGALLVSAVCAAAQGQNTQNAVGATNASSAAASTNKANNVSQSADAQKATALLRDKFVDVLLNGGAARVEALLKRGANPNVYNKDGLTPLMQALSASETLPAEAAAVRKALYKYGADPNLSVKTSRVTGLMGEVLWDRGKNVSELLQHGANPNLQNSRGQTALMWAMLNGRDGIAKILLAFHADSSLKDKEGKNALDYEKKPIEIPDMSGVSFAFEGVTPAEKKRLTALLERARIEAEKRYRQDMRKRRADIAKQIRVVQPLPAAPEVAAPATIDSPEVNNPAPLPKP